MYYTGSRIAIICLLVLVVLIAFAIIPESWFTDVYSDREDMTRSEFWIHTIEYGGLLLASLILGFGMIFMLLSL